MFRKCVGIWTYSRTFVDSVSSADGPGKPLLNSVAMETGGELGKFS